MLIKIKEINRSVKMVFFIHFLIKVIHPLSTFMLETIDKGVYNLLASKKEAKNWQAN
jgi:hypothetical protein